MPRKPRESRWAGTPTSITAATRRLLGPTPARRPPMERTPDGSRVQDLLRAAHAVRARAHDRRPCELRRRRPRVRLVRVPHDRRRALVHLRALGRAQRVLAAGHVLGHGGGLSSSPLRLSPRPPALFL